MEKYYTPTIEEFHVGFEYEHAGSSAGFEKRIVEPFDLIRHFPNDGNPKMAYQVCIEQKQVRVKRLDREDIESLGWKFEGGQMIKDGASMWENGIHQLRFWNNTTHVEISFNRLYKKFDGEIFNKSELRFIMKRLGI